ncbi:hypothetical protein Sme01_29130 [Sphaerisporangium melleum]|uniref:PKD domain-containing protein n=1 Tax=Sphaerisporangium melleum TaxID=321316 RepID=A0A917R1Y2_9ACTN|nr:hypothetical protein GCM10007964_28900 [Sphaerisporangium melleum]GII70437.1 hypothetical protein Sme01_29130 [Sphaerisporangium melleum]
MGRGARGTGRFRAFFQMDTSTVIGTHILRATFQAYQHSGPCEPGVELWVTGEIGSNTTWLRQPRWLRKLDAATASDEFGACMVGWPTTGVVAEAAARGDRYVTFGLRATDERTLNRLHVFETDVATHPYFGQVVSPYLYTQYNTAPDVPSELGLGSADDGCDTVNTGEHVYSSTTTPALSARFTDPDVDRQQMRGRFQWAEPGGETLGEMVTDFQYVDSRQCVRVPADELADGKTYLWRVRAEDQYQVPGTLELGSDTGEWSPWREFTVDVTAPERPEVSSAVFPEKQTGGRIGSPGELVFSPGGSTDVIEYEYSFFPSGDWGTVAARADGTAAVTMTFTLPARYTLTVTSIDRAGHRSPDRTYEFTVGRNPSPAVSSADYPEGRYSGGSGVPGRFTFTLNGAQDVVAYRYRLNTGAFTEVPAGDEGTAEVTVTPGVAGLNSLVVTSVDGSGYASYSRTYTFYAGPAPVSSTSEQ